LIVTAIMAGLITWLHLRQFTMVLLLQINAAELGLRRNILRGFEECSIRLCWKREREGKLRDRGGRQAGLASP
jgi:hypothetical protein